MAKKLLTLFLSLVLTLTCLTACSSDKASEDSNASDSTSATAEENGGKDTENKNESSSDKKTEEDSENADKETEKADSEETTVITTVAEKDQPFFSDFTSVTIDGKKVDQDILKGNKITMVNVWGTFCSACLREMPELQKISKNYEDKDLKIVGMIVDTYDYSKGENTEEKIAKAEEIMTQTGVTYTNILPSESLNDAKLDYIFTVPTTYFLDENGVIIGSAFEGSRSYEQWSSIIDDILASM